MIELTGYDHTNNRGFKKLIFAEKQGGGATVMSDVADTIQKDDWVEMTLDDTTYHNVTMIKKISEPAGSNVPDSTQGTGGGGGGGAKKSNLTKEEWAEKDRRKRVDVARGVAVKAAAAVVAGTPLKSAVPAFKKLSKQLEAYALTGDFDAEIPADEPCCPVVAQPDNTPAVDNKEPGDEQGAGGNPGPEDDDIPF
jgi:hypothetical protein